MIKFLKYLILIFFLFSCDNIQSNVPNVKKSNTGICHQKGSQYYNQTKNFKSFSTIKDCLNSGGRLPR